MKTALNFVILCILTPVIEGKLKSKHADRIYNAMPSALLKGIERLESHVIGQDERIKLLQKTIENQEAEIEVLKNEYEKENQLIADRKKDTNRMVNGQNNETGLSAPLFKSK